MYYGDQLLHYGRSKLDGAKRGSGRYPLGSGERPHQHDGKGLLNGFFNKFSKDSKQIVNAKGEITEYGNKLFSTLKKVDKSAFDPNYEYLEDYGVKRIDDNTDMLKKGSVVGRYSNVDETLDEKEKYVFLTEEDQDNYKDFFGDKKSHYQIKKDLKIANARVMAEAMVKTLGNRKLSDVITLESAGTGYEKLMKKRPLLRKSIENTMNLPISDLVKLVNSTDKVDTLNGSAWTNNAKQKSQQAAVYVQYLNSAMSEVTNRAMMKNPNSRKMLLEEIKAKDYDAVVDVEDKIAGYEYPLIILNPKDSLVRKTRI